MSRGCPLFGFLMRRNKRFILRRILFALWLLAVASLAVAWGASYYRELAIVRAASDPDDERLVGRGYVVVSAGRIYVFDGIRAGPLLPRHAYLAFPPRWYWSGYQSVAMPIDVVDRFSEGVDGIAAAGFAIKANTFWDERQHAVLVPCWFVLATLVLGPTLWLSQAMRVVLWQETRIARCRSPMISGWSGPPRSAPSRHR